jgi:hypothetical protein
MCIRQRRLAAVAHIIASPATPLLSGSGIASLRRPAGITCGRCSKQGGVAADVIQRVRQLAKKADHQKTQVDINDVIRDVVSLGRGHSHSDFPVAPWVEAARWVCGPTLHCRDRRSAFQPHLVKLVIAVEPSGPSLARQPAEPGSVRRTASGSQS